MKRTDLLCDESDIYADKCKNQINYSPSSFDIGKDRVDNRYGEIDSRYFNDDSIIQMA